MSTYPSIGAALVCLLAVHTLVAAQRDPTKAPPGDSSLSGRVTRSAGGPLAGVRITVITMDPPRTTWSETTGPDGAFRLTQMPAGRFRVHAHHPQYLLKESSRISTGLNGGVVELAPRQSLRLDIVMQRGGVVTGHIFDGNGDPMPDIDVKVYGLRDNGSLAAVAGRAYKSNDVGMYRVANLPAGRYYVGAVYGTRGVRDASTGFAPTWFPDATSLADARRVDVKTEGESAGIDIRVIATRLVEVTGRLRDPWGNASGGATVELAGADGLPALGSRRTVRTRADGTYEFDAVPPGAYELRATWRPMPNASLLSPRVAGITALQFLVTRVYVGDDLPKVRLDDLGLLPAPMIQGSIRGPAAATIAKGLTVRAIPMDVGRSLEEWTSPVGADLSFRMPVMPGRFTLRLRGLPEGLYAEDVTFVGRSVGAAGTEVTAADSGGWQVTIGDKSATLIGRVSATTNLTRVVVFASEKGLWKESLGGVRTVRPNSDGSFSITGMMGGDYRIVALEQFDGSQQYDSAVLKQLVPISQSVSLRVGETNAVALVPKRFQ